MIKSDARDPATSRPLWRRAVARVCLMALLWLALNGTDYRSWVVGLPVVLLGAWISAKLLPQSTWHWSLRGVLPFAWHLTKESIRGGWDVARRALRPGRELDPGFVSYTVRLPAGPARLFFCALISLLPGTVVVSMGGSDISIHALDISSGLAAELNSLEERVADLFDIRMDSIGEAA